MLDSGLAISPGAFVAACNVKAAELEIPFLRFVETDLRVEENMTVVFYVEREAVVGAISGPSLTAPATSISLIFGGETEAKSRRNFQAASLAWAVFIAVLHPELTEPHRQEAVKKLYKAVGSTNFRLDLGAVSYSLSGIRGTGTSLCITAKDG